METSSGGGAEATIRVLSLDDARTLSDTVFARRDALKGATSTDDHDAGEPAEGTTLLTLPPGELVMLGLIDNRNLLWVGAVLGAFMQVVNVETLQRLLGPVLRDAGVAWLDQLGLAVAVLLALATLVAVLAVGKILSVVAALVKYYGYRLDEQGQRSACAPRPVHPGVGDPCGCRAFRWCTSWPRRCIGCSGAWRCRSTRPVAAATRRPGKAAAPGRWRRSARRPRPRR